MSIPFDPPRPRPAAAGGGGGGGGAVAFVGQYNTNKLFLSWSTHNINPDTVLVNEGITPGYGWIDETRSGKDQAGLNYWKVSSDMAGLYEFSLTLTVSIYTKTYPNGYIGFGTSRMNGPFIHYINGSTTTEWIAPKRPVFLDSEDATEGFVFNTTTVVRMAAESELQIWLEPNGSYNILGNNTTEPGGQVSIIKIAD